MTGKPKTHQVLLAAGAAAVGLAVTAIFVAEKRRPLRSRTQAEPGRSIVNLMLGTMSMAVINLVEKPITQPLARRAETKRQGIAQWLPVSPWLRDAAAVLMMDYTIYLWHIATHKVPFLWRFHLVHHVDMDLDTTTALRFHAADMAISAPYRAAQVVLLGVSSRALRVWQAWFFLSVWFHHSNLALPARWEHLLARFVTTPRMHGIHHSAMRAETNSNWSSGLSFWDHLHGTFRLYVPQDEIAIGVPAYRKPSETGLLASLAMPFGPERNAWVPSPAGTTPALERSTVQHRSQDIVS
ncbi:sterol desaturase family protein [Sphingomonas sp. TREG-RG-20F-R18-01]|uniref:sterol desaturase family protein n=1 Tax=Sphingomonas sp. TREG-RG-20F-R18-01 TaxID=2914982 RepID=UPI001F584B64|nr:sterol desaturase family protein [Sphingomonas sp. TREG-RG-20F-R18-01]